MTLVPEEVQLGRTRIPIGAFIYFEVDMEGSQEEEEQEDQPFAM